jgi:hypothetical protein
MAIGFFLLPRRQKKKTPEEKKYGQKKLLSTGR